MEVEGASIFETAEVRVASGAGAGRLRAASEWSMGRSDVWRAIFNTGEILRGCFQGATPWGKRRTPHRGPAVTATGLVAMFSS